MPAGSETETIAVPDYVVSPYTILYDQQEGHPWTFQNIRQNASDGGRQIIIPTKKVHLKTGDYTIEGFEDRLTIERKSMTDCVGTFGGGRERFERELARMSEMEFGCVIIEATMGACLDYMNSDEYIDRDPKFKPKSFFRTPLAWSMGVVADDFPKVHFWFMDSRWMAERAAWFILDRYWRKQQKAMKRRA